MSKRVVLQKTVASVVRVVFRYRTINLKDKRGTESYGSRHQGMTRGNRVIFDGVLRQRTAQNGVAPDKRIEDPSEWTEGSYGNHPNKLYMAKA